MSVLEEEESGTVTVTESGVTETAHWESYDNLITIVTDDGRSKATQLNGLDPEWVATDLLRAIIRERGAQ